MKEKYMNKHKAAVERYFENYDSEVGMTAVHTKADLYHSKLAGKTVHPIRETLEFAVALMYCNEPEKDKLAFSMIDKVLRLQDSNPDSDTYGIWSYFLEEPLEEMDAPDRQMGTVTEFYRLSHRMQSVQQGICILEQTRRI